MTATEQCREAGLQGSTELHNLTKIPHSTLYDWHKNNQLKFKLAIDAALYRKSKRC